MPHAPGSSAELSRADARERKVSIMWPKLSPVRSPLKLAGSRVTSGAQDPRLREPLRTTISRWLVTVLVAGGLGTLPWMIICCFVPIVALFAVPAAFFLSIGLIFEISHLAYMAMAQADAPPHRTLPYLTWNFRRCLLVDKAVLRYLREGLHLVQLAVKDWMYRKIVSSKVTVKRGIHYGSAHPHLRLNVYTPKAQSSHARPTFVFLPPQIRFMPSPRFIFASLGYNLAERLDALVLIAEVARYPAARLPEQVEDIRLILRWAAEHASTHNADPSQIYLVGHGLSALVAQMVPIQEAVVMARDEFKERIDDMSDHAIPNGIRGVRVYGKDVVIPRVAGLLLISPITDVDAHILHESTCGVHSISIVRRVCGPTQVTSLHHSPTHLLYASRDFGIAHKLPRKVLFLHGGLDESVDRAQSEVMKELLRGLGVPDVRIRVYEAGHWDVLTDLMGGMRGRTSEESYAQLADIVNA